MIAHIAQIYPLGVTDTLSAGRRARHGSMACLTFKPCVLGCAKASIFAQNTQPRHGQHDSTALQPGMRIDRRQATARLKCGEVLTRKRRWRERCLALSSGAGLVTPMPPLPPLATMTDSPGIKRTQRSAPQGPEIGAGSGQHQWDSPNPACCPLPP